MVHSNEVTRADMTLTEQTLWDDIYVRAFILSISDHEGFSVRSSAEWAATVANRAILTRHNY